MPWKIWAVKNGREMMSDATYYDKTLADSYANQARLMGAQQSGVIFVDDIEARKLKRVRALGI